MTIDDVTNLATLFRKVVQRSMILIRWLEEHLFLPTSSSEVLGVPRASLLSLGDEWAAQIKFFF